MVVDETDKFRAIIAGELNEAIDALTVLSRYFGRETLSTAIGELSELLVAEFSGAERTKRGTRGHDLKTKDGQLIEVKSRFLSHYADTLQFNFRKHTSQAHIAFCIVWVANEGERPRLEVVLRVPVPFLLETWAKPKQPRYCARTTLGALSRAAQQNS